MLQAFHSLAADAATLTIKVMLYKLIIHLTLITNIRYEFFSVKPSPSFSQPDTQNTREPDIKEATINELQSRRRRQ